MVAPSCLKMMFRWTHPGCLQNDFWWFSWWSQAAPINDPWSCPGHWRARASRLAFASYPLGEIGKLVFDDLPPTQNWTFAANATNIQLSIGHSLQMQQISNSELNIRCKCSKCSTQNWTFAELDILCKCSKCPTQTWTFAANVQLRGWAQIIKN